MREIIYRRLKIFKQKASSSNQASQLITTAKLIIYLEKNQITQERTVNARKDIYFKLEALVEDLR